MSTKQRSGSLMGRMREYFRENPNEYLTMNDIAAKFGCSRTQAYWAVASLRNAGEVETMHVVAKARAEAEVA